MHLYKAILYLYNSAIAMQLQYFAAIFLTKIAKLQFLLNGARELQVGEIYEEMRKFKEKNLDNKINCIPLISFDYFR